MTHHSYFTGFCGFDFAAEICGIKTTQQCEIDKYCQKFEEYFFPDVKRYGDINNIDKKQIEYADIASAGFPCQNISHCGKGAGIYGEKSRNIFKFLDIAFASGYKYIVFENPTIFNVRGFDKILCELSKNGYDAQWTHLQACDFGYPHRRKRIIIVAYPNKNRLQDKLFLPIPSVSLLSKTKKTEEIILRFTNATIHTKGNYLTLCGVDGYPKNFRKLIAGLGNAINVTVAEYVFRCIIEFDKHYN